MRISTFVMACSLLAASSTFTVHADQAARGGRAGGVGGTPQTSIIRPIDIRVITGSPYSAEIVTESIQTLADGNRIVQRSTGRVYRDAEGRVRREDDRPSGSTSISISDPVANTSFTLDPANRIAIEAPRVNLVVDQVRLAVQKLEAAIEAKAGKMPDASASNTAGGRGGRGARGRAGGGGSGQRGDRVEEQLPNRAIEGVQAAGVRRTTTIPANAIGNERPITVVSEEWTSIDLQVLVMTDVNDPRTGRSTYRLVNITRADPDPDLFKVPAGYTVQRAGGRGRGRGGSPD